MAVSFEHHLAHSRKPRALRREHLLVVAGTDHDRIDGLGTAGEQIDPIAVRIEHWRQVGRYETVQRGTGVGTAQTDETPYPRSAAELPYPRAYRDRTEAVGHDVDGAVSVHQRCCGGVDPLDDFCEVKAGARVAHRVEMTPSGEAELADQRAEHIRVTEKTVDHEHRAEVVFARWGQGVETGERPEGRSECGDGFPGYDACHSEKIAGASGTQEAHLG